jgi:hypothetical protein
VARAKKTKKTKGTSSDWRKKTMTRIRKLVKQADPDVIEEVKWKVPSNPAGAYLWSHDGMISTGETLKQHLRLAFAKGPQLKRHDPKRLINSYRAIIIREDDKLNETAFKSLIRAAVKLNTKDKANKKTKRKKSR